MASLGGGGGSGAGEGLASTTIGLLGSTAVRNVALACLAVAGVTLSVRSITGTTERAPKRTDQGSDDRRLRKGAADSRRASNGYAGEREGPNDDERKGGWRERETGGDLFTGRSNSDASSWAAYQSYGGQRGAGAGGKNIVAIFWDMENCAPNTGASGHEVAQAIRRAAQSIGPKHEPLASIVSFKAYLELSSESQTPNAAQVLLRSELQGSGVSLIDTPKSGRKDVADKMMIADLLSFAIDKRPPALIVLLSGDRDFAYPLGILRNRGYEILLITPPTGATPILEASANHKLRWRQDVLGLEFNASGKPYDKKASSSTHSSAPQKTMLNKEANLQSAPLAKKKDQDGDDSAGANAVPSVFKPLIDVLERNKQEGQTRPLRSRISAQLKVSDPDVYSRAEASGWSEYVAIAEAAGIVILGHGSMLGREWVALPSSATDEQETPIQIMLSKGSQDGPSNLNGTSDALFYPLIEAHKSIKASGKEPTTYEMAALLDEMIRLKLADPYTQANVATFDEYVKLAYRRRVARLSHSSRGMLVQIHPRLASVQTGVVAPNHSSVLVLDKANLAASEAKTSKASPTVSAAHKTTMADPAPTSSAPYKDDKSAKEKSFPHQPSGEVINVLYFPLANLLLTKRSEGQYATRESQLHQTLSKHHKLGKFVQGWNQFQSYLQRAEEENIVTKTELDGEKYFQLAARLCQGEGDDKHKGFAIGQNSYLRGPVKETSPSSSLSDWRKSTSEATPVDASSAAQKDAVEVKKDNIDAIKEPSEQFNSVRQEPGDRQKFKPLVDALVSLRKQGSARLEKGVATEKERATIVASSVEPLRGTVATTIVSTNSYASDKDGQAAALAAIPAPGIWLQMHGHSSFTDYFNEAERKGFVHLVSYEGRERVRLAQRYEMMFFPPSQ